MSFPGLSRPMRSGGFALLAIALVAVVVGGVVLTTGGGDSDDARQASAGSSDERTTDTPAGSQPESSRSSDGATDSGDSTGGESRTDAGDGATGSTEGATTEQDADRDESSEGRQGNSADDEVPVRVYNNSLIKDLASEAAEDLQEQGWDVAKVSNYSGGVIPTTTAYYRKGTDEKAAALSVAGTFGIRAKPRFDGIEDAAPGLIIIVAKDYESPDTKTG